MEQELLMHDAGYLHDRELFHACDHELLHPCHHDCDDHVNYENSGPVFDKEPLKCINNNFNSIASMKCSTYCLSLVANDMVYPGGGMLSGCSNFNRCDSGGNCSTRCIRDGDLNCIGRSVFKGQVCPSFTEEVDLLPMLSEGAVVPLSDAMCMADVIWDEKPLHDPDLLDDLLWPVAHSDVIWDDELEPSVDWNHALLDQLVCLGNEEAKSIANPDINYKLSHVNDVHLPLELSMDADWEVSEEMPLSEVIWDEEFLPEMEPTAVQPKHGGLGEKTPSIGSLGLMVTSSVVPVSPTICAAEMFEERSASLPKQEVLGTPVIEDRTAIPMLDEMPMTNVIWDEDLWDGQSLQGVSLEQLIESAEYMVDDGLLFSHGLQGYPLGKLVGCTGYWVDEQMRLVIKLDAYEKLLYMSSSFGVPLEDKDISAESEEFLVSGLWNTTAHDGSDEIFSKTQGTEETLLAHVYNGILDKIEVWRKILSCRWFIRVHSAHWRYNRWSTNTNTTGDV